ncbi:transposase [Acinetobacter sp. SAAs470]|uniref:transposase n=1 Tax=unclassified Acinetobacter TaxID=196816 RepID=UPI0039773B15
MLEMYPRIMLCKFINNLTTVLCRLIPKAFSKHLQKYDGTLVVWIRAYCGLTTGDTTIDTIRQ